MRPIMLVGTASEVGKSFLTTGICRWLHNHGYTPAPFKAQNMSLNSYATLDGLEVARAQATQAAACRLPVSVEMSPILLKPTGPNMAQIVLHGKPIGNQHARDYFSQRYGWLFEEVTRAFDVLAGRHRPVVIEGAGSISELNLKHRDIVNMRMAQYANACVYLVASIDRGGVFGSVYGTMELLEDWERKLIKGVIINKFQGDEGLFASGKRQLEELARVPVLGVLPYAAEVALEAEDSVALQRKPTTAKATKLNIAVVRLHYVANHTDFEALAQEPLVQVYFTRSCRALDEADVIIIPGTKNTIADLLALRADKLDEVIGAKYGQVPILGICGGYQILGKAVHDPYAVEGDFQQAAGLGLFPIETTLTEEKTRTQRQFLFKGKAPCMGYEIHMGRTVVPLGKQLNMVEGKPEGYFDGQLSWGSYFHGIFDNKVVVEDLLRLKFPEARAQDYGQFKERQLEAAAQLVDQHLAMDTIVQNSIS